MANKLEVNACSSNRGCVHLLLSEGLDAFITLGIDVSTLLLNYLKLLAWLDHLFST